MQNSKKTFTLRQFQLGGASFENTKREKFKCTQRAWGLNLKPALNTPAPVIGMVVGAKRKNAKIGETTTIILKSFPGGKILSLTDIRDNGLSLKIMRSKSNKICLVNERLC